MKGLMLESNNRNTSLLRFRRGWTFEEDGVTCSVV